MPEALQEDPFSDLILPPTPVDNDQMRLIQDGDEYRLVFSSGRVAMSRGASDALWVAQRLRGTIDVDLQYILQLTQKIDRYLDTKALAARENPGKPS